MKGSRVELGVGVFVLLGILCVAYLTIRLGKMELYSDDGYRLTARFGTVSGLKAGAVVDIAGVQVGRVDSITLDQENLVASIVLHIDHGINLDSDTIASVKTSGLIGDKYVRLQPGGGEKTLKDGDEITQTQSSVDIEDIIGKYAFGDAK